MDTVGHNPKNTAWSNLIAQLSKRSHSGISRVGQGASYTEQVGRYPKIEPHRK